MAHSPLAASGPALSGYQSRLDQLSRSTQSQPSLLIGSMQACVGPEVGVFPPLTSCLLCKPLGSKRYTCQGDLTRHLRTAHGAPSRFLYHIDRCPRSIPGEGFGRRDKLVDHLKSSKPGHRLSHQDAVYQASLRNRCHVQAVPQALLPSAFNDASADPSVQLGVSQVRFVQQAGLDDVPRGKAAQSPNLSDTIRNAEAADPSGWQVSSGQNNLALHNGAFVVTAEQSSAIHIPAQQASGHSALSNMPREMGFDQGTFDDISLEGSMDGTTFDDIFYTEDYLA